MSNHQPFEAEQTVLIEAGDVQLEGILNVPSPTEQAKGLVVFVHGSGSSRFSPRNHYVADLLNQAGLATLLFDLLTQEENRIDTMTREFRFDIDLLSRRTIATVDWLSEHPTLSQLSIGLFGASTGAAAALNTAKARPNEVECVVSRGGRPDLAMPSLPDVLAPTLLIVGSLDWEVLELNKQAQEAMRAHCELVTIEGATHLFEEPGTLPAAAETAKNWFIKHLQ
ncbi:dienelactone hydrolase family protein [Thiomicrorhabdus sp. zzn3]|uniref:dienelactone hydrolase family protein n=1 Tax=Thiomicrorhabdus sp. zzn3 TaxID=3039775 RepID=UPI002436F609|nr:dienelactone hydrolase family protein [Thiomicrorhabdus sp. zzn3]MDG6777724.1 dienelactone hydrolase family protein [Thiomicrorhabdus sp. zzn3]